MRTIIAVSLFFFLSLCMNIIMAQELPYVSDKLEIAWAVDYDKSNFDGLTLLEGMLFSPEANYAILPADGRKLFFDSADDRVLLNEQLASPVLLQYYRGNARIRNLKTGELLYKAKGPGAVLLDKVEVLKEKIVYMPFGEKSLACLDLTTGEKIWECPLEGKLFTYTVADKIYAADIKFSPFRSTLYFIDKMSGDKTYMKEISQIETNIILQNNLILYGTYEEGLNAFNTVKRELEWRFDVSKTNAYNAWIHEENGVIFYLTNHINAIDIKTGKLIWNTNEQINGDRFFLLPGFIVAYTGDPMLNAISLIDKKNGKVTHYLWDYEFRRHRLNYPLESRNNCEECPINVTINFSDKQDGDYIYGVGEEQDSVYCFKVKQ
jgi:hypothetical protein